MKALARGNDVDVSELVLGGTLRILTHPKVFQNPTPLPEAVDFIEDFRARPTVHILSPGDPHWPIFVTLCRKYEALGNLVPDAYHAALAIEHGCHWASLDRGFARYESLEWVHPLD
ncbi:MAG: TA system VapC family ribonuclease toxin [Verrucomicrobiota bacterium]